MPGVKGSPVAGLRRCCHPACMTGSPQEVAPALAEVLGVDADALAAAIGEFRHSGTEWDGDVHIYTGRSNPRAPERPVVVLSVDVAESEVEVGRAVGVPLPDGRTRWALAGPRTSLELRDEPLLLADLADAVVRVLDRDMLRGVAW